MEKSLETIGRIFAMIGKGLLIAVGSLVGTAIALILTVGFGATLLAWAIVMVKLLIEVIST